MAEPVGFEPTEPARAQRFSRPPQSTTLPRLRGWGVKRAAAMGKSGAPDDFSDHDETGPKPG